MGFTMSRSPLTDGLEDVGPTTLSPAASERPADDRLNATARERTAARGPVR